MDVERGNGRKLPHMKKQHHQTFGTLIRDVFCSEATYNRALEAIERATQ